jgi:hypothetical protein
MITAMTDDERLTASAQAVFAAIDQHREWSRVGLPGRRPRWLGEVVSSVLLAIAGEPIMYVSLDGEEEGLASSLRGAVLTDSFAVSVVARGARGSEEWETRVELRALRHLERVDVRATVGPFEAERGLTWPGEPEATLYFRAGGQVRLPQGRYAPWDTRDQLVAVVRRLPEFLR